jgi:hypothetical protein
LSDASTNVWPSNEYLYVIISEPPLFVGGVNTTLICLFPPVAEEIVGTLGTVQVVAETRFELDESPTLFVARNKTLYSVLFVRPVTTMGETVVSAFINAPPFKEYLYVVIAVPPSLLGGVNDILSCLFVAVTDVIVGALGTTRVVVETTLEPDESPIIFVARSKTLYSVLSLSPVTTMGDVVDDASINACPFNEYLYVVIAVPPLFAGGVNAILICLTPPVTDEIVGASGISNVVAETTEELDESPTTVVARSNTLYSVLLVSPVTIIGEVVVNALTNAAPFNEYLYVVIDEPPLFMGGVNDILICLFPPVTDEIVGAPGIFQVVAEKTFELDESPTVVVARNATLYNVLSFSPVTTMGDDVVNASTNACPFNEYLYVVIAEPPLLVGGKNAILICLFPGVTDNNNGALGLAHVVPDTLFEFDESPNTLLVRNKTLYVVLSVSPVTTMGEVVVPVSTNEPPFNEYLYENDATPSLVGGVNAILICLFVPVTDVIVGGSGIYHVVAVSVEDADELPMEFVATIYTE